MPGLDGRRPRRRRARRPRASTVCASAAQAPRRRPGSASGPTRCRAKRIEGTLLSADSDAVTLVPKSDQPLVGGEITLPAGDVTRLDVALEQEAALVAGRRDRRGGGRCACAFTDDVDPVLCEVNENVLCRTRGEALAVYGLTTTALGAGIGALIKTDRWTPVALDAFGPPSPPLLRESRAPFSLGVTLRF